MASTSLPSIARNRLRHAPVLPPPVAGALRRRGATLPTYFIYGRTRRWGATLPAASSPLPCGSAEVLSVLHCCWYLKRMTTRLDERIYLTGLGAGDRNFICARF